MDHGGNFVSENKRTAVPDIIEKARGEEVATNVQGLLSVKDWKNLRVVSKGISQSPSALFQTKKPPKSRVNPGAVESGPKGPIHSG